MIRFNEFVMNTFGKNLRLTTFGESHGPAMGGVIDGFPAGFRINFDYIHSEIEKRKPGTSGLVSGRKEEDLPEFLSGISPEGITLGTPIGFIIRNSDCKSKDYEDLAEKFRPNHADFTYFSRFGIREHRGGGRASARETVNWVIAGALASQWLESKNIYIYSLLSAVGKINFKDHLVRPLISNPNREEDFKLSEDIHKKYEEEILKYKNSGNSIGGIVTCLVKGLEPGIGEPVFRKLHAALAQSMMGINGAKAFEYGSGFNSPEISGVDSADLFIRNSDGHIATSTNYSGGIQGGISNGMPIFFSVYFKPTPTVMRDFTSVDLNGKDVIIKNKGRHDPCIAVRAVPVVKAMTALTIADFLI